MLPTPATTFLPLTLPTSTTTATAVTVSTGLTAAAVNEPADAIIAPDAMDQCPMGYFHCNISAQCVPQRLNCDDKADCDDASDEWNCVNDVDAKFWDHFFRKQPYGRHDDVPVETCCKCWGLAVRL